jgi:GNAT superfamily N-acetyltransferase
MALIREVEFDKDAAGIAAIDTSFVTAQVYEVSASGETIALTPRDLATQITKRFPLDDLESPDRPYDRGWVAVEDGRCVAFAATAFEPWNRRQTLWHLYVDGPFRGQGLARRLLDQVEAHGRSLGALHMWLETSSLNLPGVAAYRARGFSLTGG